MGRVLARKRVEFDFGRARPRVEKGLSHSGGAVACLGDCDALRAQQLTAKSDSR